MRWLAKEPPRNDPMESFFRELSRHPADVDFSTFDFEGFSFYKSQEIIVGWLFMKEDIS